MGSTITASPTELQVTVGVETHKQFHVAHAADALGRTLGNLKFTATSGGYRQFAAWTRSMGQLETVGIKGPGHYGAGLGRYLRGEGITVTEVGRPKRQRRARYGKSDHVDAAGATAIVLAGEALGEPKTADGLAEMVWVLRVARTNAVRARAKALTALKDLIVTAPDELREHFTDLYKNDLLYTCRIMDVPQIPATPTDAIKIALKSLAIRCRDLDTEAQRLERHIDAITATAAPALRNVYSVLPNCAATNPPATTSPAGSPKAKPKKKP